VFRPRTTPQQNSALNQSVTRKEQFTVLAPHYDELMQVVPYTAWVEYVALLFEIAGVKPCTVLDCACGTGNVSFELAQQGLNVTGVDISTGMIEAAQAKSKSTPLLTSGGSVKFLQTDLTSFDLNEKFDAATCLYDSFNYILKPEQLQRAFAEIAKHINPGGVLIFDLNTPHAFEANLFTQRNRNPKLNLHYDWRARYDASTRLCEVTMLFERRNEEGTIETFSEVHRERSYSRAEINAMLIQTGWEVLKVYDAYTLNPPHEKSERWYFVARRL
jgi:SAM-dependent methyltransferase